MKIYDGKENYLFISYAHKNSDRVIPILNALDRAGAKIWYDQGIVVGTEWPMYVADRLESCHKLLLFVTSGSVESLNCRNEVNYALLKKKEVIVVYLDDVDLKYGLALQLSAMPSVRRKDFSNDEEFVRAILEAWTLQPCTENFVKANTVKKEADKKSYQVFISYRRKGGAVVAKLICSELQNRGYSVFYDYDSLKGGYFDDHIVDAIMNCKDFILVLPKRALARCRKKSDWVRQEIICALESKKNIIPVMVDGFEFPKRIPAEISDVARCNGVRFEMAYLDAVIDKIIDKFDTSK